MTTLVTTLFSLRKDSSIFRYGPRPKPVVVAHPVTVVRPVVSQPISIVRPVVPVRTAVVRPVVVYSYYKMIKRYFIKYILRKKIIWIYLKGIIIKSIL